MKTEKCINCGGDYAIHAFETLQCPKYGIEATTGKQEYQNSWYAEHTVSIAQYNKLKDALTEIANHNRNGKLITSAYGEVKFIAKMALK